MTGDKNEHELKPIENILFPTKPSTRTFIGRSDAVTSEVIRSLNAVSTGAMKDIYLIGSGVVEPITTTGLGEGFKVHAIDIDPQITSLLGRVLGGGVVSWDQVATISTTPGKENIALNNSAEREVGFRKLQRLGIFDKLNSYGGHFNQSGIQLSPSVAGRIEIIPDNALSVIRRLPPHETSLIVENFVRVNINTASPEGETTTRDLLQASLEALTPNGIYLIGDTGNNISTTIQQLRDNPEADIQFYSLADVDNINGQYLTSSYIAVSRARFQGCLSFTRQSIHDDIYGQPRLNIVDVIEKELSLEELTEISNQHIILGYLSTGQRKGIAWYMNRGSLRLTAPHDGDTWSPKIGFVS